MSLSVLPAPASICIFRLSAIGDVTHVIPMIHAIRSALPSARITWVIGKFEHRLVSDFPSVEFIPIDKKQGMGAFVELRKQLKDRQFDALLLCQMSLRASLISSAIKARTRIGFDWARSKEFHSWFINKRIAAKSGQHVLDALGSFLEPLGISPRVPKWDIPIGAEDQLFATHWIPDRQLTLVISPCSSHILRNWDAERYAKVADYAISKHKMRVILVGGPSKLEREVGDEIKKFMTQSAIDLIGKDTLKKLLALLKRANVLISPDSGPMHMANAVGTPVIGLHAATDAKRSGPYNFQRYCINKFAEAAQKFENKAVEQIAWGRRIEYPGVMDLIEVEEACAMLDLVLAEHQKK